MDRSRYYSPEELYDKSAKWWEYGLSLEYAPGLYEEIDSNQVLYFVSGMVSKYHVNLHDEDEIDVPIHRMWQPEHDNIPQSLTNTVIEVQTLDVVSDYDHDDMCKTSNIYGNELQVGGHYAGKLVAKNRKCNNQNKHKTDPHSHRKDECDEYDQNENPTTDNES